MRRAGGDGRVVVLALASAAAVRLYLAWQNASISADGVQYVDVAAHVLAGDWVRALASFYPPGYPALVAIARPAVGDWERAGTVVSLLAGVLTLLPLAGLARLAGLEGVALAATLLGFAVSPYPARYAAAVRAEAAYGLCFVTAVYAAAAWIVRGRRGAPLAAGLATGAAYLIRPEGLGLVAPLGAAFVAAGRGRAAGLRAAAATALVAALVAAPYVLYLHADTGRWLVSRKAANVVSLGIHEATGEGDVVSQGASAGTSLGEVLRDRAGIYARKLLVDSVRTFWAFAECLHFVYLPFVLGGIALADRRRRGVDRLLHAVVWFYVAVFALTYVDRRFYTALVPLALVWGGSGFAWAWARLAARRREWALGFAAVTTVVVLAKSLRVSDSTGYVRVLGREIARADPARPLVAARDLRVAFYAHGRRARVAFPVGAPALRVLAAEGAWLVALDGDLAPAARALAAAPGTGVTLVRSVPASRGKRTARLYRLRAAD
jgi:hypothetical protein